MRFIIAENSKKKKIVMIFIFMGGVSGRTLNGGGCRPFRRVDKEKRRKILLFKNKILSIAQTISTVLKRR